MSLKYISDNKDTNSHGGSDILIDVLQKRGMVKFFDEYLGPRNERAEYTYGESILTLFASQCRGGTRTEHLYDTQRFLKRHPKLNKGMSPDTLSYIYKELSVKSTNPKKENISDKLAEKIKKGKAFDYHEVNVNEVYNELLILIAIKLGLLKPGMEYILDYDTTEIINKMRHSRRYYKGNGKKAYCPAVGMINKIPIYIENRNGDSNASFNLVSVINRILELLKKHGIVVKIVRVDAAAYSKEFTSFIASKGLLYVTRARALTVKNEKDLIDNWAEITIKESINKVGDKIFWFGNEETRMIIKKVIDNGEVKYWGIITNDFETSNEEMLKLYAKRGDCENLFSSLKEFGWKVLPTYSFEANTTFLYFSAINYVMYRFVVKQFTHMNFPNLKVGIELKTFIKKFMSVGTYWKNGVLVFSSRNAGAYIALSGFT